MREALSKCSDLKNEKCMIEQLLRTNGHIAVFLPKFHPELNPIERVWAQLKRFTKAHCKYSNGSLRKNIPLAYDSVTMENIHNHFRKVRHYMFAYLEGLTPGVELEMHININKFSNHTEKLESMNNILFVVTKYLQCIL